MNVTLIISALVVTLSPVSGYERSTIEGRQVIREIFPAPLVCNDMLFGAGYNSITLSRTEASTVQHNVSTTSRHNNHGFISHSFQIKHFSSREALRADFDSDSEITKSEGFMGISNSDFIKILRADDVTLLDSLLVVDIDIVTDTTSMTGQVSVGSKGKTILETREYTKFIEQFGTHYLRKKIFGGKLIFLIKISSKSKYEKDDIDQKLKMAVGSIGNDPEFRMKMTQIEQLGKLHMFLYTLGGVGFVGDLNLDNVIDYVLQFSRNVLVQDAIRELEFLGFWKILGVPRDFGRYIFSFQHETDKIMGILSGLQEVETEITDIALLRFTEMTWLSDHGWSNIADVKSKIVKYRGDVRHKFANGDIHAFWGISEEYTNTVSELKSEIGAVLQEEKHYGSKDVIYLKSGTGTQPAYVSTANWEYYATASTIFPIPLFLEDSTSHADISYSSDRSTYIKSPNYPDSVLCMGPHYYGIYWKSLDSIYQPYCTWYIKHSTAPRKGRLQFGDKFVLYNVNWQSFTFGLDRSNSWIVAVYDDGGGSVQDRVTWQLEKEYLS